MYFYDAIGHSLYRKRLYDDAARCFRKGKDERNAKFADAESLKVLAKRAKDQQKIKQAQTFYLDAGKVLLSIQADEKKYALKAAKCFLVCSLSFNSLSLSLSPSRFRFSSHVVVLDVRAMYMDSLVDIRKGLRSCIPISDNLLKQPSVMSKLSSGLLR